VRNDPGPVAGNIAFSVLRLSQAGALTCGIAKDGTSYCWGNGPIGINPPPSDFYLVPTPMPWTPRFVTLDIGQNHMCGLTAEGEAWCWGSNWYGQIGIGANDAPGTMEAKIPTRVMGGHAFRMIATSSDTTCAMEADGSTWCWGLATGGPGASNLPIRVSLAPAFISIHATLLEMCGLTATGDAWCWAGAGVSPSIRPQRLSTDARFARLASHPQCGLDPAGRAWCWGNNDYHQLGY
jgi:alpha-tubulin suppressor-like RCC1 family protein